jgi:hypothetical protein
MRQRDMGGLERGPGSIILSLGNRFGGLSVE